MVLAAFVAVMAFSTFPADAAAPATASSTAQKTPAPEFRVTDGRGRGVANGEVAIISAESRKVVQRIRLNARGVGKMPAVPRGEYLLEIRNDRDVWVVGFDLRSIKGDIGVVAVQLDRDAGRGAPGGGPKPLRLDRVRFVDTSGKRY